MSNTKQIGLGALQYAQDYDEQLPAYSNHACAPAVNTYWWAKIDPYVKNTQVFRCPSAGPHGGNGDYAIWYTHTMGCSLARAMGQIVKPSEAVMFSDGEVSPSTDTSGYYIGYCRICNPTGVSGGREWGGIGADRHNGGGNCVYVDGHSKWISQSELLDGSATGPNAYRWGHLNQ